MNTEKINYYEKAENDKHLEFIQNHSHCALCGTVLELHHVLDEVAFQVKEEARCPDCEIRTRAKIHTLN